MKRTLFCIAILICLNGSAVFGIAPIGQPTPTLRKGWWNSSADFSMTKIDLDVKNSTTGSFFTEETLKDYNIDLLLGKAGYGITDNWEVFVGLGAAKIDDLGGTQTSDWGDSGSAQNDIYKFDPDTGYAAQIGTKITLYEKALIKAGVTCQFTWLGLGGTLKDDTYKDTELRYSNKVDVDSDLKIFQIAPGVSYEFLFGFSVYGGPFFQWVDGEAETDVDKGAYEAKMDITSDSSFGGWVGLHADIDVFTSLNLEYQITGSSGTIGINLSSKF